MLLDLDDTIDEISVTLVNSIYIDINDSSVDFCLFNENMKRLFILYELMESHPRLDVIPNNGNFWHTRLTDLKMHATFKHIRWVLDNSQWCSKIKNENFLKYIWFIEYCSVNDINLKALTFDDVVSLKDEMVIMARDLGIPNDDDVVRIRRLLEK